MTSTSPRHERGAVTAVVVVLVALLVVLTAAAVAGARVLVTQRRAAAAADLGALAGAVAVQRGDDPCLAARHLATRSGARLTRCVVVGARVRVTAVTDVGVLAGRRISVAARAHAGPR